MLARVCRTQRDERRWISLLLLSIIHLNGQTALCNFLGCPPYYANVVIHWDDIKCCVVWHITHYKTWNITLFRSLLVCSSLSSQGHSRVLVVVSWTQVWHEITSSVSPRHGAESDTLNSWPQRRWGRPADMLRWVERMQPRQVVLFVPHTT